MAKQELNAEQVKAHEANLEKGLSALHKALAEKKVNVDAQTLAAAVKAAQKEVLTGCQQCANGWHW